MRKFAKPEDEAEINMTPMLDIVFIMLIFFIVTASFVKEAGLDVNKPDTNQPPPPEEEEDRNIVIRIDNNNRVSVLTRGFFRPIDIRSVRANVDRWYAEHPDGTAVIQPDSAAHAGLIVEIYDQARQAGVYNVSIAEGRE